MRSCGSGYSFLRMTFTDGPVRRTGEAPCRYESSGKNRGIGSSSRVQRLPPLSGWAHSSSPCPVARTRLLRAFRSMSGQKSVGRRPPEASFRSTSALSPAFMQIETSMAIRISEVASSGPPRLSQPKAPRPRQDPLLRLRSPMALWGRLLVKSRHPMTRTRPRRPMCCPKASMRQMTMSPAMR
jgi:hypothetical protein